VRDYFHVLDIVDAHLLAMEKIDGVKGNSFNLGSGEAYSVLQIIKGMEIVAAKDISYEVKPARKGDPSALMADISKAYKMLGWSPKRSLIDILESAYAWQKNRPY
jgi:UDP-glucose 4-epimerase